VTPLTVIGAAADPLMVPVFGTPPLVEVQVAVWVVMASPLSAPSVYVTVSDPVEVVVDPETASTDVGAAGAPGATISRIRSPAKSAISRFACASTTTAVGSFNSVLVDDPPSPL